MDKISRRRFVRMLQAFCSSVLALEVLRSTAAEAVVSVV